MNSQTDCVQLVQESKRRERREYLDASDLTEDGRTVILNRLCEAIKECFEAKDFASVSFISRVCELITKGEKKWQRC